MKICKKIRKIIKIRLKNFSTKNQKSILADTPDLNFTLMPMVVNVLIF